MSRETMDAIKSGYEAMKAAAADGSYSERMVDSLLRNADAAEVVTALGEIGVAIRGNKTFIRRWMKNLMDGLQLAAMRHAVIKSM